MTFYADCASDPPLGATARALAVHRAADVIYGLGACALGQRGPLRVAAAYEDAARALGEAIRAAGAAVEVERVRPVWPIRLDGVALPAAMLVRVADAARGRPERRYLTVAGQVARPVVIAAPVEATIEALVAEAGGALVPDWVALAGGTPTGRRVDRATRIGEVEDTLVLVVSHDHPAARRERTPLSEWRLRAKSACEGCRVCTDGCPEPKVQPHEILATLATGRDDGLRLTAALACTACGLCDVHCPAELSPRALVGDVARRLTAAGARANLIPTTEASERPQGLDRGLATLRLGLGSLDRAPEVRL
jgi:ferredoxin